MSKGSRIVALRAFTIPAGGADYHDQATGHWIDGEIATPMSRYREYRTSRSSFGLNVLGCFIVEVEAESGEVGIGVSTGGLPACWIAENHLARFVEGQSADRIELIWDQMWRATQFYGRKGLVMNVISAIDLALWDLLGHLRQEPVYNLIGGELDRELVFYATTPRPDVAKELGFIGAKLPLMHGPADGPDGLHRNIEIAADARARVGDDYFLGYDAWMSLDVDYALRLIDGLEAHRITWLEEPVLPDDYWGYAEIRRRAPTWITLAGGEHEAGRLGFRMLIDMRCVDIIQPDVAWCGGLTELLKIAAYANMHGVRVVPHGSSVYSYHFMAARANNPFAEFVMLSADGTAVVPMFSPLFRDEPVPVNGRLRVPDRPGFGVELDRSLGLERVVTRTRASQNRSDHG